MCVALLRFGVTKPKRRTEYTCIVLYGGFFLSLIIGNRIEASKHEAISEKVKIQQSCIRSIDNKTMTNVIQNGREHER